MTDEELLKAVEAIQLVGTEFPELHITYENSILILMSIEHQYRDEWSSDNIRAVIKRLQSDGSFEEKG